MGTFSNLFDLLRDTSYREVEDEATREVIIAIAGNTAEVRDKLHRALSSRLESLWTSSPYRLIEPNERPAITQDDEDRGGLLLFALNEGDRLSSEKRRWLRELAASGKVAVLVVALARRSGEIFDRERKSPRRLPPGLNPLRLVGGRETGNGAAPAADGAAFNNAGAETKPAWQTELDELQGESGGKLAVIHLAGLEIGQLAQDLLPKIVDRLEGRELALARRAPIFRNIVASHFIAKTARSNAELVLLANLTSGIPLFSNFFDSGADFVVLTKNQFELSHRLASVYGQKRDSRVEVYLEIAPIVGMAFAWKTLSNLVIKRVPALFALLPKAAIAYAATFAVGWLAQFYYAGGRKAPARAAEVGRNLLQRVRGGQSGQDRQGPGDSPRRLRSS